MSPPTGGDANSPGASGPSCGRAEGHPEGTRCPRSGPSGGHAELVRTRGT